LKPLCKAFEGGRIKKSQDGSSGVFSVTDKEGGGESNDGYPKGVKCDMMRVMKH